MLLQTQSWNWNVGVLSLRNTALRQQGRTRIRHIRESDFFHYLAVCFLLQTPGQQSMSAHHISPDKLQSKWSTSAAPPKLTNMQTHHNTGQQPWDPPEMHLLCQILLGKNRHHTLFKSMFSAQDKDRVKAALGMRNWRLSHASTPLQPALPKLIPVQVFPAANTYPCSHSPCSWYPDVAGSLWEPVSPPCPSPAHWGSQQNWWNCTSEKQIEENTQVIPAKQCWVPYNEWIQQNLQEKLLSQTPTGCPEGKVRFIQHQL